MDEQSSKQRERERDKQALAVRLIEAHLDKLHGILRLCLQDPQDQDYPGLDLIQEKFQQWRLETAKLLSSLVDPNAGQYYLNWMRQISASALDSQTAILQQVLDAQEHLQSLAGVMERNPRYVSSKLGEGN